MLGMAAWAAMQEQSRGFEILGVVGYGLVEDLYGDDTVQDGVPGTVHRTLAASGYPLEYLVSTYALEHLDLFMDHKRLK